MWAEEAGPAQARFHPRANPVPPCGPGSSRAALDWTDPCVPAAEWQVAEAAALVRALPGWSVARTLVVPSAAPGSRLVFGKGNFRDLTGERYCPLAALYLRGCRTASGPPPNPVMGHSLCSREDQGMPGYHVRVPQRGEDGATDQGSCCPPDPHVTHDTM